MSFESLPFKRMPYASESPVVVILPVMLVVLLSLLERNSPYCSIPCGRDITGYVGGVAVTGREKYPYAPSPVVVILPLRLVVLLPLPESHSPNAASVVVILPVRLVVLLSLVLSHSPRDCPAVLTGEPVERDASLVPAVVILPVRLVVLLSLVLRYSPYATSPAVVILPVRLVVLLSLVRDTARMHCPEVLNPVTVVVILPVRLVVLLSLVLRSSPIAFIPCGRDITGLVGGVAVT